MESRAKLLGHAIHPMLIVFPLGLWMTSIAFDVIALVAHLSRLHEAARYLIAAGVVGGLASALFGAIDWVEIPEGSRAKALGLWHGLLNALVTLLFLVSCILRETTPARPPVAALVFSFTGGALALITGWLGGELIERLGIGVDTDANVNAGSSLKRPSRAVPLRSRSA